MGEFDRPIGRAWRRLRLQRFLSALVWSLAATLAVAVLTLGIARLIGRPLPGPNWAPFAAAIGSATVLAVGLASLTGPSRLDAALAIDRVFDLDERLSTVLSLPAETRETPVGRALVADAARHATDLPIGERFGLKRPGRAWVPLIPAAMALAIVAIPDGRIGSKAKADRVTPSTDAKAIAQQARALGRSIAQKRKDLDPAKFAESQKLFAEIEKAADRLTQAPPGGKDKALVQLNQLTDALKERQKALGGSEQVAKQLQQLKMPSTDGPADELAKALSKGDFQKAAQELKQLKEKLASGKMTEKEQKNLKQQMGDLKKQLEQLANLQERRKQLDDAKAKGQLTQEEFEKQKTKLDKQAGEMKKLQQLAKQLGQAQEQMTKGDAKKAAEAMGMGQQELEQMARQMQEIEGIDDALADLQDAKDGMTGQGANQLGNRLSDFGEGNFPGNTDGENNQSGPGGRGRGQGPRPEAKEATSAYNSKVRQQIGKGAAIQLGTAPPREQQKGESTVEIQSAAEASSAQAADALSNQKVPGGVRKHISGYFDEIRKGH